MANNQVQKGTSQQLAAMLKADSVQAQFKNALGEHKDVFVASLIDLYNGDKSLQSCSMGAVVCEALKAAALKLPINKALGNAYIVVYNNNVKQPDGTWVKVPTPTFILGYKGYIQLAMRTGWYKTINADVVYEGEYQSGNRLTGEVIIDGGKRTGDKVAGYFAYFELLNGFSKALYMSVEDMAKYAIRYSPSMPKGTTAESLVRKANEETAGKGVGWSGNFNDMAIKTCVRRLLSKYGYLTVEMQSAMSGEIERESAEQSRDGAINETANTMEIGDVVQYEDINDAPAAGQPQAPEQPAIPEPEY